MIPYLFHVSILLAGGYAFYWLLLRHETFFRLNRIILLTSLLLPLVLPLVTIPAAWSIQLLPTTTVSSVILPSNIAEKEISLAAKKDIGIIPKETRTTTFNQKNSSIGSASKLSMYQVLTYLYFTGVFVFLLAFFIQLILILAKKNTLNLMKDGKYQIVELVKEEAPYSFWHSIFINPAVYDPDTYEQIVAHEKIHIDQAHFIDKLIVECLLIAFWFNPFVWLFRKAISNNLEFLTDQSMLTKGFPKQAYQLSLLKVSVPQYPLNLTTNYNQSFLKNRIAMMNTKKSSARSVWKYLCMLPLLGFSMMSMNTVKYYDSNFPSIPVDPPIVSPAVEKEQPTTPIAATPNKLAETTSKKSKIKVEKQAILDPNAGLWKGEVNGNKVCFFLDASSFANVEARQLCFLKEEIKGFSKNTNRGFSIEQAQGTLFMEGSFSTDKGQGTFTFKPNPSFVRFLKNEEMIEMEQQQLIVLFFHNISRTYIKKVIQESINKGIKRHSLSFNEDEHVFAIVNNDHSNHPTNQHSDGKVSVETINGTTYVQGAGTHNINGTVVTVTGDETWVVEQDGSTHRLKDGANKKGRVSPKRKTHFNSNNKIRQSSSGVEQHYLKGSKGKGHLDWIGYQNTMLPPSTQPLWELPAFCQALQSELVKDEIIDDGDKILFYFGQKGVYVNGWHLSGGHETKYFELARKYNIRVFKGWNIELDGQNVLVVGSAKDVEQLRKDLQQAFIEDDLIANKKEKILMKIYGNRLIVNGSDIPKDQLTKYFQLLQDYRITPSPGKIIQMGKKKGKHYIHVGYGGDNSFLGTFSSAH